MTETKASDENSIQVHKDYLKQNVNIYLEPLVKELLINKPTNVLDFMIDWLTKTRRAERGDYDANQVNKSKSEKRSHHSFASSDEEFDDAQDSKVANRISVVKKKNAISGEGYNPDAAKDFKARVIEKSESQSQSIRKILSRNFMFNGLSEKDKEVVVNAMEIKEYQPEEFVIKQGDNGAELFIVESGTLKCTLKKKGLDNDIFIKNYSSGELFGELALMYNVPRAASIVAIEKSVLFALDRETFNNIVKGSIIKTRERNEMFLSKIDILADLEPMEIQKLCDCLQ